MIAQNKSKLSRNFLGLQLSFVFYAILNHLLLYYLIFHTRNYTKVVWYLLTESKALRKAVLEKYQNTERLVLSATNITIEHTSNEESVCGTDGCEVNDAAFESASGLLAAICH